MKLQQQLKSTAASGKGGAAEAERSKKELEKLRQDFPRTLPHQILHLLCFNSVPLYAATC